MTLRDELHTYLKSWTYKRMHAALQIHDPIEDERTSCFLCNGFTSKMDMLQKVEHNVLHSTMMDIHHSGRLRGEFTHQTFELFFSAREPEYTDADRLANATDRAQAMMYGFIKDITADHKRHKKEHIQELPLWFDIDNLNWETAGPFGDGWETLVLYLSIVQPFNYC